MKMQFMELRKRVRMEDCLEGTHLGNHETQFQTRKWNDAEKWIMNRQNIQANHSKKNTAHNQANRMPTNMGRVAPESGNYDFGF